MRVLQTHLQGNLEKFLGWAEEELNDIFETTVPNSSGAKPPSVLFHVYSVNIENK